MNDQKNIAVQIDIHIVEGEAGLFYATSDDLSGLFVAGSDIPSVLKEIPEVIEALFAAKNISVKAVPVRRRATERTSWPWVAVPPNCFAKTGIPQKIY